MERCCWSSYCWRWARLQPTSQAMASRYTLVCAARPKRIAVPTDKAGKLGLDSCSDRRRFAGIMQLCAYGLQILNVPYYVASPSCMFRGPKACPSVVLAHVQPLALGCCAYSAHHKNFVIDSETLQLLLYTVAGGRSLHVARHRGTFSLQCRRHRS